MNILQLILQKRSPKKDRIFMFAAEVSIEKQRKYVWAFVQKTTMSIVYIDVCNQLSKFNPPPQSIYTLCIGGRNKPMFDILRAVLGCLAVDIIIIDSLCSLPWMEPSNLYTTIRALTREKSIDIYLLCEANCRPFIQSDFVISLTLQPKY